MDDNTLNVCTEDADNVCIVQIWCEEDRKSQKPISAQISTLLAAAALLYVVFANLVFVACSPYAELKCTQILLVTIQVNVLFVVSTKSAFMERTVLHTELCSCDSEYQRKPTTIGIKSMHTEP